ncbi:MAG: RNA polymerase sigma factor [Candidatus Aminicenantaceae bacterium]
MAIVTMYQRNVFQLAYSFFHNREDALDIVQDTFFQVYRKLHYHEKEKGLKNWILKIAKNLCVDRYIKTTKSMIKEH